MEAPLEALVPSAGSDKLPYRLTHDLRDGTALNFGHCLELAGQVRVESQHHVLHFGHTGIVISRYRPVKSRRPLSQRVQIAAWHQARFTNAPTEAANNLIKRVKRVAFGFTRFRNYADPRIMPMGLMG